MKRRDFISLFGSAAAVWPLAARAQSTGKKYTIGYLSAGSPGLEEATAAFTDTLRELGWVEGKNVTFERRFAENRLERLAEFAAELVHLRVDVIVTDRKSVV
jgi:putative ABC transport system substrate-binding protein